MATTNGINAPSSFNVVDDNLKQRWESWLETLNMYFLATGIDNPDKQKAILLYCGGSELRRIFKTIETKCVLRVDNTDIDVYNASVTVLNNHFSPKENLSYERSKFRSVTQMESEGILSFITRLREQSSTCKFDQYSCDAALMDQFIEKCTSNTLRKKLLATSDLNLDTLITIAQSDELATQHATAMEKLSDDMSNSQVKEEDKVWTALDNRKPNTSGKSKQPDNKAFCYGCGRKDHYYDDVKCPAKNKQCHYCGKRGHFEDICQTKQREQGKSATASRSTRSKPSYQRQNLRSVAELGTSEPDPEDYLFSIINTAASADQKKSVVLVDNIPVEFVIDSGANCNIIDFRTFTDYFKEKTKVYPSSRKIFTYASTDPLPLHGVFYPTLQQGNRRIIVPVNIGMAYDAGCILSESSSTELGLLTITAANCNVLYSHDEGLNCVLKNYNDVFSGLGKLKDFQLKLDIDDSVPPVIQSTRTIPYHQRKEVEQEIERLLQLDVIEPSPGPTSWCSPLHVQPKSDGALRICVDLRKANEAVKRTRHPIPTLEDVMDKISNATIFSKIDLRMGYHQIELTDESRDITTFSCSKGIFRYKRLVFGLNSAFEQYQHIISDLLTNEKGITNISDDILIFGSTQTEHDRALERCLEILRQNGLTANQKKCLFRQKEIEYYGFKISAQGMRPIESKVQAIQNFAIPSNTKEVRSFLGLVNYLGRYIPHLATLTQPLRELTKKDQKFEWNQQTQKCFDALKDAVTSSTTMEHFKSNRETKLITDASPVGLGAILLQQNEHDEWRPVFYASRSLSKVEQKYSQTEREALGVIWGCERFHLYVYGKKFDLETDHKPLIGIFDVSGNRSPRIHRWSLRLLPYNFNLKYIPGPQNPADPLSRNPLQRMTNGSSGYELEAERQCNFTIAHALPKAVTLSDLLEASETDEEVQEIKKALQSNTWHQSPLLKPYVPVKDELAYKSGLVLRGDRIIIPQKLRKMVLELAHESHMGITKTKALMRTKVWWPNITKDIDVLIKQCSLCLSVQPPDKGEPLRMTKMPSVWSSLHADICGPLPDGWSIFGIIDESSRWPTVYVIKSTSTSVLIRKLRELFATMGRPNELVTDNGPQFTSYEFKNFCKEWGIHHRLVTPYYPQANSEIERFFRTMMKNIKISHAAGLDWKNELQSFLLQYRNTPHSTTNETPSNLMFNGRTLQDKLPGPSYLKKNSDRTKKAQNVDHYNKSIIKKYADRNAKVSTIKEGDIVLVRQKKKNKFTSNFGLTRFVVLRRKYGSLTLKSPTGQQFRRHITAVKKVFPTSTTTIDQHSTYDNDLEDFPDMDFTTRRNRCDFGFNQQGNTEQDEEASVSNNNSLPQDTASNVQGGDSFVRRSSRHGAGKPPERYSTC